MSCLGKYLMIVVSCMLVNLCNAEQAALKQYIDLTDTGKYQIIGSLSYNNHNNANQEILRKEMFLAQLNEKKYMHVYIANTGFKKQDYSLYKRYSDQQKELYYWKFGKKPIDVEKIGWDKSTAERWFGTGLMMEKSRDEVQIAHDELFSMLGPITEATGELKRYKVQYKRSGKWQKNGVVYDYDDYDLVEPIAGILRMCYADGKLKMCIKNQRRQQVKNDGFGDYQLDEAKAVVVEFKQFDSNVDSNRFNVKM